MISTFPPEIGNIRLVVPPADWRVALFLVLGAMVSTVFFALAPALQATRVELVRAIRGEVVRDARPGRARNALLALQVTGSVLLLICAAIFLRSSWAAAAIDPGIRTAGIVTVGVLNEQRRGAILEVLKSEPQVASVAASLPGVLGGRPALADGASGKSTVTYQFVSPEYFGILGIDLVRGRGFTETERSADAAVAVVSEGVARQLWPGHRRHRTGRAARARPRPERAEDPEPAGDRRRAAGLAQPGRRRRRTGRGWLPAGRLQDGGRGRLRANQHRGRRDDPHDADAWECGACASGTRRSAGGHRSQHGRGRNVAGHGKHRDVSACHSVLADAGAWRAGAAADVVGAVQRALLSRRAAHQGDRRADGAGRDPRQRRRARAATVGPSRRHRAARRWRLHRPRSAACCWRRPRPSRSGRPCVSSIRSPTPPACSALSRPVRVRR